MRRIAHLVWHDLRSQRLALLAFGLFLVVEAVMTLAGQPTGMRRMSEALVILRGVLVALVTGLVVQQDALTGTSAFWRTRPVGRATLLASKTTTLAAVLVALPGLLTWLLWLRLGLFGGDAARAALGVMIENTAVVLLTALAASVTPSLTYLVVAAVAGGTMLSLINGVLLPAVLQSWPELAGAGRGQRPDAALAVLFALCAPALAYQFLRLREWHTAIVAGIAIVASSVTAWVWPAAQSPIAPVDTAIVDPAAWRVSVEPGSVRLVDGPVLTSGRAEPDVYVHGTVTADGHPADVIVWVDHAWSRLLLRDRTVPWEGDASQLALPSGGLPAADVYRTVANAVVSPATIPEPATPPRPIPFDRRGARLAGFAGDLASAYAGQRALLTTDLTLVAVRVRAIGPVPAKPGSQLTVPGAAATVSSVRVQGDSVVVRLRVARVRYASGRDDYGSIPFTRLVLRNARRSEAVMGGGGCRLSPPQMVSGPSGIWAEVRAQECAFVVPVGVLSPAVLDAAWLADAELLSLESAVLGAFTKEVQTDVLVQR